MQNGILKYYQHVQYIRKNIIHINFNDTNYNWARQQRVSNVIKIVFFNETSKKLINSRIKTHKNHVQIIAEMKSTRWYKRFLSPLENKIYKPNSVSFWATIFTGKNFVSIYLTNTNIFSFSNRIYRKFFALKLELCNRNLRGMTKDIPIIIWPKSA